MYTIILVIKSFFIFLSSFIFLLPQQSISPCSSSLSSPSRTKHQSEDSPIPSYTGDKVETPYTSHDWVDSGLETISCKTFTSSAEASVIEVEQAPAENNVPSTTPVVDEKVDSHPDPVESVNRSEPVKDSKPLSVSDYHSESDGKIDVISVGVKSDEGFSETSEELSKKLRAKTMTAKTILSPSQSE